MFGKKEKSKIEEAEELEISSEEQSVFEAFENDSEPEAEVKKKKKLPGWVIIPVIAVVVLIGVIGSKFSKGSNTATVLEVVKVEQSDVKEVYNTSGTVESDLTKVFYSPVNAPIATCNAKVGTAVKAGDQLIVFDTKDLEKNNKESQLNALSTQYSNQSTKEQAAKSGEEAAKAQNQKASQISSLQNQIAKKESSLKELKNSASSAEQAQQAMEAQKKTLNSTITSLTNAVRDLETENQNLTDEITYVEQRHPEYTKEQRDEFVSKNSQTIADNRKTIDAKKGELDEANKKMANLGSGSIDTGSAVAAAEQEIEGLRTQLQELQNAGNSSVDTGLTSGQVNGMAVAENLSELSALTTEELLAKGREGLKAEFDGVISDVKATQSGDAAQGMELYTLVSNQSVGVKLEVASNDFDKLKIGGKATIKVGEFSYQGTLTEIDKIAVKNEKGNPVIGAKVHIDNPDENIYIGVTAKVTVTVAEEENVLNIPNEAVNTSSDGEFVYIIKDGTVKKQAVELGVASNSKVEIKSGLKAGDEVVTDTSGSVKEGMKATAQTAAKAK